ncbi:MAG: cobalamin-dependent protein, partial [Candidatus Omnitrophica bacterium]|nr:cobalamin-dependent protein [Candidatus Omnitrophota bacterium]
ANAPYSLKDRYGKMASVGATLPSLGLLSLGAVLRKAGHRVRIVDASAQSLGYKDIIKEVENFNPHIIGLTAVTPAVSKTARLASMIKDILPSAFVIIGGSHVTAVPEQTMIDHPCFDYGVLGEGEDTIIDLIEALSANKIPADVPGIVFRENGKVELTPQRQPIKNLDSLPWPAWDLLDEFPFRYHPAVFKYKKLPSVQIVSARGCPNKCIFCDTSVFGHKVRFHSAEYILDLAAYLIKDFKIREIIFEDDQFLINKERVEKICNGFLKYEKDISWSCSARVNCVNDPALLKLMKRSGCWQINYGLESGDQKILDFANKAITLEQAESAVQLTHQAGILSKGYFIFGLPHETEETMDKTIRFAKRIPLSDVSVFMLTPFPGSRIYTIAEEYGTLNKNFEKMNILNVVYIPKGLSKEILLHYQKRFMKKFYLRGVIIVNYLRRIIENPANLFALLKAFYNFLRCVSETDNVKK